MKLPIIGKLYAAYGISNKRYYISLKCNHSDNCTFIAEVTNVNNGIKIETPESHSSLIKPLMDLQEEIRSSKDRPVLLDLLCKTIEYDLNIRFIDPDSHISPPNLKDKIRGIVSKGWKTKNTDHWGAAFDIFNCNSSLFYDFSIIYLFIDELRHLILDCRLDQIEKSKICRLLANAVFYRLDCLRVLQNFCYIKGFTCELFMMLHGIDTEETAMLQRCKNTRIIEEFLSEHADCISRAIYDYKSLLDASYHLNWYLAEKYFDKDKAPAKMCHFAVNHLKSTTYTDRDDSYNLDYITKTPEDCIRSFYLNLYYKMRDSDDKSHIDRFVESWPDDLGSLTALFWECMASKGYLNTKTYEIAAKFLDIRNNMTKSTTFLEPPKIDVEYIDIELFKTGAVWERLLSLAVEEGKDINQIWSVYEYVLEHNHISDKEVLVKIKDDYREVKRRINAQLQSKKDGSVLQASN